VISKWLSNGKKIARKIAKNTSKARPPSTKMLPLEETHVFLTCPDFF